MNTLAGSALAVDQGELWLVGGHGDEGVNIVADRDEGELASSRIEQGQFTPVVHCQ